MALSKLQASVASITNEITVAAASIKFDFSLVKYEAPKEYHELGNNLSEKRKQEAEFGTIHVTAQKLGALFEGICPQTPNLVRAYGKRVSEISVEVKEKASKSYANSIFAAHSGIDGSSIWAAATSSTAAIQVQLLACILARIWEGPEATSLWVELVSERKKEIAASLDDEGGLPFSTYAAAAQLDMPRSQLAEWDASARAWLQTADRVKQREQNQLMLIINNLDLPVNTNIAAFPSIVKAWHLALETIEKLICGMPQAVFDGAALLGVSAWHIYPDLAIVLGAATDLPMKDPLITSGGTLTVGLNPAWKGTDNHRGVYWSLSLAHLRYYGHPIRRSRQLHSDMSRVSFIQLTQAIFGALLGYWQNTSDRTQLVCQYLALLQSSSGGEDTSARTHSSRLTSALMRLISQAASAYLNTQSQEFETVSKLVGLGQRRRRQFFGNPRKGHDPIFELENFDTILCQVEKAEDRVAFLRHVAKRISKPPDDLIIVYSQVNGQPFAKMNKQVDNRLICYATALPKMRTVPKRKRDEQEVSIHVHRRWIYHEYLDQIKVAPPEETAPFSISDKTFELRADILKVQTGLAMDGQYQHLLGLPNYGAIFIRKVRSNQDLPTPDVGLEEYQLCLEKEWVNPNSLAKILFHNMEENSPKVLATLAAISSAYRIYEPLSDTTVAITVLEQPLLRTQWASNLMGGDMEELFVEDYEEDEENMEYSDSECSMEPKKKYTFTEIAPDRPTAFSCVAYLESGCSDVEVRQLTDVFALSSGDCLYVVKQLLCDPYERQPEFALTRILGNVGKPGITMLIPIKNPMVRERDPGAWSKAQYSCFDGAALDCFNRTSLHLSFTEFYMPVFDGVRGRQDSQVYLLEAVISVVDAGNWIADIDIVSALNNPMVRLMPWQKGIDTCTHDKGVGTTRNLTSVECWDEILDMPTGPFVVRANGNWIARLAIISVLERCLEEPQRPKPRLNEQKKSKRPISYWFGSEGDPKYPVLSTHITICPRKVCWRCNWAHTGEAEVLSGYFYPHVLVY